jgi:NCAIR mutase (PurE)-related protein
MTEEQLRRILGDIRSGALTEDQALERLKNLPFEDLGFANIDHHRTLRQGFPEVIFGAGKSSDHVARIVGAMLSGRHNILVTRANAEQYARVKLNPAEFTKRLVPLRLPIM